MNHNPSMNEDDLKEMVLRLAHEIRNPLATIQSAVQLLEHVQKPEGEVKDYFDGILQEVARIDTVVRDMQRFVRLDSHTATQIPVSKVAKAAVDALRPTWEADSERLRLVPGADAYLLVDRQQVETAITELIENALRFSPPGTPVIVSWARIDRKTVRICVEDQGPGVPADLVNRIFRPFFSTSTQGTGLGLNIVSRVADLAGGSFKMENLEPAGARFTLILPVLAWI